MLYQAGADPYRDDQLGGLALTLDGLAARDRRSARGLRRARHPGGRRRSAAATRGASRTRSRSTPRPARHRAAPRRSKRTGEPMIRAWIADANGARVVAPEEAVREITGGTGMVWIDIDCEEEARRARAARRRSIHPLVLEDMVMRDQPAEGGQLRRLHLRRASTPRAGRRRGPQSREIDIVARRELPGDVPRRRARARSPPRT